MFGALLDADRGGAWTIEPDRQVGVPRQFYAPDPNVLITRFYTADGLIELQDCNGRGQCVD